MSVRFVNNSVKVKNALQDAAIKYLYEAGGELTEQVQNNTRVDTGKTKGSFRYRVNESKLECTVGSPLNNAIWEEFGTGEFALHGNGRKGGWSYQDKQGNWHHTEGKTPTRAFHNAFQTLKPALINRAKQVLKTEMTE